MNFTQSQFIATEPLGMMGEKGEKLVWETIKSAFSNRRCLGYWHYPIFSPRGKFRKEPDILIADYQLGLIIIEVKAIALSQIVTIQGHRWQYHNFYTNYGNPYQQAEQQLFALLEYTDSEPILKQQVSGKVLIALPYITAEQWHKKGFTKFPHNPPIIFQDDLDSAVSILNKIIGTPSIISNQEITETQWKLLQGILAGTSIYRTDISRNQCHRNYILQQVRARISKFDLQQEKLAKQIPPGIQTIRGVAGSGKTVILCQKAALMSLKHPEWNIAVVFFSRSLYETITQQIDSWLRYFSHNQVKYDPETSNIKILHAWGSKTQPGFYRTICKQTRNYALAVAETQSRKPNEALAEVCYQLLLTTPIPQVYDAILIDEAQDLLSDNWLYQDKQPFYWLAYQSLRPVNPIHPQQKRLIWAYDELQSLSVTKTPTVREVLGESLAYLGAGEYSNRIPKHLNLNRCYRTPHEIVNIANALALGFLRPQGMLTNVLDTAEWNALGYQVIEQDTEKNQITLQDNPTNKINLLSSLWEKDIIQFNHYDSRLQELTVLANRIKNNLEVENLKCDRQILVIILGTGRQLNFLEQQTAKFLMRQGINIYLPSSSSKNCLEKKQQNNQANRFWWDGALTISNVYRAKGQEADIVYLIGLDNLAKDESNIYLRNQFFTALTRTRGWAYISGIGDYKFYQELKAVMKSGDTFKCKIAALAKRTIKIGDRTNLLQDYALGRRDFRYANLQQANLSRKNLVNINLIAANLSNANLQETNLTSAKLIAANLSNANLQGANLTNAKLMGANLTGANLKDAIIHNTDLTNAVFS
ncbi:MAG: pentapeptide repeat-containing protein [Xenococcaceae cyanobacterium MO_167.B27]|nr:pentapeptide repeat-containing protein [Xenococcaceae cyanobacterium MO_167.B27]